MRLRLSPGFRAALIAFHVLALVLLSLPRAPASGHARWNSRLMRQDVADWAAELRKLSVNIGAEELRGELQRWSDRYGAVQRAVLAPFELYSRLTGARQGWAMFASPQRHPSELHVDGLTDQGFVPLYRPHDPQASFMADYFRHNRVRKFQGRFARAMKGGFYDDFAAFVAERALEARPDVREVRVRLFSYASLPPARVRAGERPGGSYDHERLFSREAAP